MFEIGDENPRVAFIEDVPAIGTDAGSACCVDFFLLQYLATGDNPPRQQKCILHNVGVYLISTAPMFFCKVSAGRK